MAIVHTGGRTTRPGVHQQQAAAARRGRPLHGPEARVGDARPQPQSTSGSEHRPAQPGDPDRRSGRDRARLNARRSLDARSETSPTGSAASAAAARRSVRQRRDRLRHHATSTTPGASLIIDDTRETMAAAARGQRQHLRHRSARADQAWRRDDRARIAAVDVPTTSALGLGDRSLKNELQLSQDSLRELAEETGGFAAVNANDFATAFERIVRDNSTYYVLAYYPPTGKAGKFHKIEVKVNRPGVVVRARQGYATPKAPAAGAECARDRCGRRQGDVRSSATRSTARSRSADSTMRVFAAPFKGSAANASVLLGVELLGRDLRLNAGDKLGCRLRGRRREGEDPRRQHRHADLEPQARDARRASCRRASAAQPRRSAARTLSAARRRARQRRRQRSARSSTISTCPTSRSCRSRSAASC